MRRAVCIAVLLGCLGGACGGEEGEVADVLSRHYDAIADGDGAAACRELTTQARRLVVVSVRAQGAGVRTCAEAYEGIAARLGEDLRRRFESAGHDVTINGDGTATAETDGVAGQVQLRETGGRWVITRVEFGA